MTRFLSLVLTASLCLLVAGCDSPKAVMQAQIDDFNAATKNLEDGGSESEFETINARIIERGKKLQKMKVTKSQGEEIKEIAFQFVAAYAKYAMAMQKKGKTVDPAVKLGF